MVQPTARGARASQDMSTASLFSTRLSLFSDCTGCTSLLHRFRLEVPSAVDQVAISRGSRSSRRSRGITTYRRQTCVLDSDEFFSTVKIFLSFVIDIRMQHQHE